MIRPIKFRAWDSVAEMMTTPFTLYSTPTILLNDGGVWLDIDEDTPVMQFTGELDRNENEIYECDVVKTHADKRDIYKIEFDDVVWQVKWLAGGFYLMQKTPKTIQIDMIHLGMLSKMQIEVIGNIYENPELLK